MRTPRTLLASSLVWITLVGAAPPRGLPQCLHGPFRGITATNEIGEMVGEVDRGDWGCFEASSGEPTPGTGTTSRLSDVPVPPPPPGICLFPASPNPTQAFTRIRFTVGQIEAVRVTIYGQSSRHGRLRALPVRTLLDRNVAAGTHEIVWNGTDAQDVHVPAGIYRVVLETGGHALCGDIEIR